MQPSALLSLALAIILSGGCGKVDRAPIDEANHLLSYDKVDQAIQVANLALNQATTPEEKSAAYTLIGQCYLALAVDAESPRDLHANRQALDDAIVAFTASVETLDNFHARYGRRTAYKKLGQDGLALDDYVAARKLDPDYQSSRINEKPEEIRDYLDLDVKHLEDEKKGTSQANSINDQEGTQDWQMEVRQEKDKAANTIGDRPRLQSNREKMSAVNRPARENQHNNSSSEKTRANGNSPEWLSQQNQQTSASDEPNAQSGQPRSPSLEDGSQPNSRRNQQKDSSEDTPKQVGTRAGWRGSSFPLIAPPMPTTGLPTRAAPTTGLPMTGPPTTGLPMTGPPTTGLPMTGYGLSPNLPIAGAPTTGIGGLPIPHASGSGFAGISPSNPTTGVGTARVGLPTTWPAKTAWPARLFPSVPRFRHGVSLPRSGADATQPYVAPSAGIPDDLAPRPLPTTFGPNPTARRGATQFGTSPLSQPIPGQSIPSVPGSLVPPSPK